MAIETGSSLERIEVFEDRVSVTRHIVLPAGAGNEALVVGPLSPLLRVSGLSIEGLSDNAIVEEIQLRRDRVLRKDADGDGLAELRGQLEAAEDQFSATQQNRTAAQFAASRAETRLERALSWSGRAYNEADDAPAWARSLRELYSGVEHAARTLLQADFAQSEQEAVVHELRERVSNARVGRSVLRTFATLRVSGEAGAVLVMRYTLPCAIWRPVHRATLQGSRVRWELSAMVWNGTGEDWASAVLVCSTARPNERATPPSLTDDVVQASRRGKDVLVEDREEAVQIAREGTARATDDVPGVDDGGEARTFTAANPIDLPSSGLPTLVRLDQWEADADVSWRAAPEVSPVLVRVTRQINAGTRPLLAGPVELYGVSGALGRTEVGFIPPGEPFDLGWGGHDDVRIDRRVDSSRSDARLSGRTSHRFDVVVRAHNMGSAVVVASIRERIPVSELAAVTVHKPKVHPNLVEGPDDDGFCEWTLSLEPGQAHELTLSYTVDAASSVTLPF